MSYAKWANSKNCESYFLYRREFEIQNLNSKIQDLEGVQNQQKKKIKDLEVSFMAHPNNSKLNET